MASIFAGTKKLLKTDGTVDSRRLKRRVADNIDALEVKFEMSGQTDDEIRKKIRDEIICLSLMNKSLPNSKAFDFRIEFHRRDKNRPFTVNFRVGGSGKRYNSRIGLADLVMPVLKKMWQEQVATGKTQPLTKRALLDVGRICQTYGY